MADVTEHEETITLEELQLATRNHGMPLEALRWSVTPVGLHYVLVNFHGYVNNAVQRVPVTVQS